MASMAAGKTTTKTYTYTSAGGKGNADVTIEYTQDLSALNRLQVIFNILCILNFFNLDFMHNFYPE